MVSFIVDTIFSNYISKGSIPTILYSLNLHLWRHPLQGCWETVAQLFNCVMFRLHVIDLGMYVTVNMSSCTAFLDILNSFSRGLATLGTQLSHKKGYFI